jgi:hypothetical protein
MNRANLIQGERLALLRAFLMIYLKRPIQGLALAGFEIETAHYWAVLVWEKVINILAELTA